jgi:dTDP-4-amino-4,6-dideoxygalactose transaminase
LTLRFDGNFTQQEGIPVAGIAAAVSVMESGRLHRYNVADGEEPAVVALEKAFAAYTGARYCLAVTSGGYALQTALRAHGVQAGDVVLTNAFTLAPVPGSIAAIGARPILVDTTRELTICLDDLERRIETSGAKVLMLSHMRGHIVDMDQLMALTDRTGVAVIEDCAHTMGASWADVPSGRHGIAACYSLQTYKHINTGEGGLIISDDDELMARATILSGSYMLYGRHETVPPEEVFRRVRLHTPNCSGRLDNLRAAIALPQLEGLDQQVERWNTRYAAVARGLATASLIRLTERPQAEHYVGSSIQFFIEGMDEPKTREFLGTCAERGVELKWFGEPEPVAFTSRYDSWQYMAEQSLPETDKALNSLFDMRIPLTFSEEDCALIGQLIAEVALERCQ